MLVVTRKVGEGILIGEDICVRVTSMGRGRVRISVKAPRETKVLREELERFDEPKPRIERHSEPDDGSPE